MSEATLIWEFIYNPGAANTSFVGYSRKEEATECFYGDNNG
jgi:hypothetical protein